MLELVLNLNKITESEIVGSKLCDNSFSKYCIKLYTAGFYNLNLVKHNYSEIENPSPFFENLRYILKAEIKGKFCSQLFACLLCIQRSGV